MCLAELDRTTDRDVYRERLDAHYARLNSIEIKDTGEGMSFEDLNKVYLRIGTRHRRRQNEEGATKLGDKGIGRLSAMRLGELLRVETSKEGERHWNILDVDWGVFSHSEDKAGPRHRSCSREGWEKTGPVRSWHHDTNRESEFGLDPSSLQRTAGRKDRSVHRSIRGRDWRTACWLQDTTASG